MASTNIVIISGNLTREPEITTVGDNIKRARFTIAVNSSRKENGEYVTDFFDCTTFRGSATLLEKYSKKGDKVVVSGRLATNNYTAQDGTKKHYTYIIANEIDLTSRKTTDNDTTEPLDVADEDLPF